jgi:translation initiation factor IF-3
MIYDVVEKYDVEVVRRQQKMSFCEHGREARELIAFRGRREFVEEVQDYLFAQLKEFHWGVKHSFFTGSEALPM